MEEFKKKHIIVIFDKALNIPTEIIIPIDCKQAYLIYRENVRYYEKDKTMSVNWFFNINADKIATPETEIFEYIK